MKKRNCHDNQISTQDLQLWQRQFSNGNYDACRSIGERLATQYPGHGKAWQLLGLALVFIGEGKSGVEALLHATSLSERDASIWESLGVALQRQRRHTNAAEAFRRSRHLNPQRVSVWINSANNALEQGQLAQSLEFSKHACLLAPSQADAHLARGNALRALGHKADAVTALRDAVGLAPSMAMAHLSLGSALEAQGSFTEAIASNLRAAELAPELPAPRINLGALFCQAGDIANAVFHSRKAVLLEPQNSIGWSNLLFALVHQSDTDAEILAKEHFAFGEAFEREWQHNWGPWPNSTKEDRKLRLGFVSADLRDHPVARFIEPVWLHLNRESFEIFVYANQNSGDAITVRLRGMVDTWCEALPLDDEKLTTMIREHQVDILFDLSGHTAGNRLPVFARKPAPIQISWLGYPGTTGLRAIDFRPVDNTVAPPAQHESLFSERLMRLPYATAFEPPSLLPEIGPLPAGASGPITFGSFNRVSKLTGETLALWARVMERLPSARLLIAAIPDATTENRLRKALVSQGVSSERLLFRARMPFSAYLELHNEVDIALDTLPFSSGTTANFAMSMGVPTVTLAGPRFVQRLCASRLVAAGLQDFVAYDEDGFVELAEQWAHSRDSLASIRMTLRAQLQERAKTQPKELTRALEQQLRKAWCEYCWQAQRK